MEYKMNLNEIKSDLFQLESNHHHPSDLALISLRIAIKAFFSTYKATPNLLNIIDPTAIYGKVIDSPHPLDFCEAFAETIFHFQHFAELSCKNILRNEHPLLCDIANKNPVVLYKLLKDKKLTIEESKTVRSLEFSETLESLIKLITTNTISNHKDLRFIITHKETLKTLNELRNKISHRGIFIMRYKSLDIFIGRYILPFVIDMIKFNYSDSAFHDWHYTPPDCGIDPIEEIINECLLSSINHRKIALLKEIGRAAYSNPLKVDPNDSDKTFGLTFTGLMNQRIKGHALKIADAEKSHHNCTQTKCPICGLQTLLVFKDTHHEDDDESYFEYAYEAKCECCSFNIDYDLEIPSDYKKFGLDDYWHNY